MMKNMSLLHGRKMEGFVRILITEMKYYYVL
jgi:hypothetical protein